MLPPAILKTTFVNRPTSFRPMDADWNNKIHDRFWWIIDVWHEWKGLQLKFYSKIRIGGCQRNCSTPWQIYTFQVIKTCNFHNFWYYFIKLKYHASLSNISGELSKFMWYHKFGDALTNCNIALKFLFLKRPNFLVLL